MKFMLLFLLFIPAEAFSLEAVVTVLETPLFSARRYDAPVVQYLRKGDVIKIHPSVANDRRMDEFAPSPDKLQAIREKMKKTPEFNEDTLFRGEDANTAYLEDEFIPTLDRQGHVAYVLSEHIYVYFGDAREFEQSYIRKDPTDYRLEEPLPKNYPLYSQTGYRGQFIIGITQPYYESYPYIEKIRTKGYTSPLDLSFALFRQAPGNYQDRLFFGGTFNLRVFENIYSFTQGRLSEEQGLRMGVGPTISYDAFKGEKNRLNLSATLLLNFVDRLSIYQSQGAISDNRIYSGYSVSPRVNVQYHRKSILEEIDFVLGTSLEVGTPTALRAHNKGSEPSWWKDQGNDSFTTRTTFSMGGYIGIQSAY